MIDLPDVTLFTVSSIDIDKHIYALRKSMEGINFGAVKFVTHEDLELDGIQVEKCEKIDSINKFNHYMIYDLHKHVDTSHVLTIHDDSFVINPEKWDPLWLQFDYIGALWPFSENAFIDPWGNHIRVGNGGFSLRSKKLLEVPLRADVPFDINHGEFYKHMDAGLCSEDGNICVHNRHIYEVLGCKFAPVEVAARFSHEQQTPETQGITPFGFHYFLPPGTVL